MSHFDTYAHNSNILTFGLPSKLNVSYLIHGIPTTANIYYNSDEIECQDAGAAGYLIKIKYYGSVQFVTIEFDYTIDGLENPTELLFNFYNPEWNA